MSKQADTQYFAGRAAIERAMSAAAADSRAAAIHAELAERYEQLAQGLSATTVVPFPTPDEACRASAL